MVSEKMKPFVTGGSVVRALFEEGLKMAEKVGKENVYDYSLGNPNVPAPKAIKDAIIDILEKEDPVKVHGYMPNQGYPEVRTAIADNLNKKFGTHFTGENIIMTVGAASALNIAFKSMLDPDDEVICFAPYFLEYGNYIRNYDGKVVVVPADIENGFMPNIEAFEKLITKRTKAVVINNPNNPTGVIYPKEVIVKISDILRKKEKEFGTVIYMIADEPYRELVYDGSDVPYLTKYYDDTLVAYSFSKSLSLPGERIGYLVVPSESDDYQNFISACVTANRIIGCVNAPSLIQLAIVKCLDSKCDVDYYAKNGKLLYDSLTSYGFSCVKPQGAFYMWVKSPVEDEKAFVDTAKKYNLLLVPGSAFACKGYVRLAYCVSFEMIERSLPSFEKLAKEYF